MFLVLAIRSVTERRNVVQVPGAQLLHTAVRPHEARARQEPPDPNVWGPPAGDEAEGEEVGHVLAIEIVGCTSHHEIGELSREPQAVLGALVEQRCKPQRVVGEQCGSGMRVVDHRGVLPVHLCLHPRAPPSVRVCEQCGISPTVRRVEP